MKAHSELPNAAHSSKSSGSPRRKKAPLTALVPPTTWPRCMNLVRSWLLLILTEKSRLWRASMLRAGLHLIPLHVLGGFSEGAIVWTFLQEEDGKLGVFGDAGGEGGPGGTRPNDDNVVLHGACAGTAGQVTHLSLSSLEYINVGEGGSNGLSFGRAAFSLQIKDCRIG